MDPQANPYLAHHYSGLGGRGGLVDGNADEEQEPDDKHEGHEHTEESEDDQVVPSHGVKLPEDYYGAQSQAPTGRKQETYKLQSTVPNGTVMSSFRRHKTNAAMAKTAEDGPNNPFTGKPLSQNYFRILKTRRDLPVHSQR